MPEMGEGADACKCPLNLMVRCARQGEMGVREPLNPILLSTHAREFHLLEEAQLQGYRRKSMLLDEIVGGGTQAQ